MMQEKKDCLVLAQQYLLEIEAIIRGVKIALSDNDDANQQAGCVYTEVLHEFLTKRAPLIVAETLKALYADKPVKH